MDVNLRLLSERLRRLLLTGEEGGGTLADGSAKEHLQNLLAESELVSSLLMDYEYEMLLTVLNLVSGRVTYFPTLLAILKDINGFANESDKVVDSIIISHIMQQQQNQGESSSSYCSKDDSLLRLQNKIIDIKQRIQLIPPRKSIPPALSDILSSTSGSAKTDNITVGADLDDEMEELLDLLIEGEPSLSVVAILGSRGFDESAFAAEAYNSNYAKNYFDCRATVSFNYYSGMLEQIMKSVMPLSELNEIMDKDVEEKRTALNNYLRNKRYLIFLEDFFLPSSWDEVREALPDHQNGSRVLTTLADIDILKTCRLENGERIQLDVAPATSLLRATYQGCPFDILYYGSKSFEENMADIVEEPVGIRLCSIFELPFHLKLCCLYLCIFHEDFEISTRELYRLWIAEGFIPDHNEATAEKYLEELINRGFIRAKKRTSGGKIKVCTIPAWTWGSSWRFAEAIEFIHFVDERQEDESLKDVKRLFIANSLTEFFFLEYSNKHLHSLLRNTSNNDQEAPAICENICEMLKYLRILDLGSRVLNQFPSGIEHLILLRYLKLNIPSLNSFPLSLCNLLNLLMLDMPSSSIDDTPDEIWKMTKLMHLNCGYIILPTHPRKYCNALENLNFISTLHASSCTIDTLNRLSNLQSLRIYGDLNYYQCELSKSLCKLVCLKSLKLVNESKTTQPSHLLLSEFQFPQTLAHLSLSNTKLKEDPMPTLEKLPQLEVLKLKQNSYLGRKLVCGSNGFPSLKVLHLKSMFWLEEWIMNTGVMPKLENLIINPCAHLKKLPEVLLHMRSLCKLEFWLPQSMLRQKLREFENMEKYDIQIYPYGV